MWVSFRLLRFLVLVLARSGWVFLVALVRLGFSTVAPLVLRGRWRWRCRWGSPLVGWLPLRVRLRVVPASRRSRFVAPGVACSCGCAARLRRCALSLRGGRGVGLSALPLSPFRGRGVCRVALWLALVARPGRPGGSGCRWLGAGRLCAWGRFRRAAGCALGGGRFGVLVRLPAPSRCAGASYCRCGVGCGGALCLPACLWCLGSRFFPGALGCPRARLTCLVCRSPPGRSRLAASQPCRGSRLALLVFSGVAFLATPKS